MDTSINFAVRDAGTMTLEAEAGHDVPRASAAWASGVSRRDLVFIIDSDLSARQQLQTLLDSVDIKSAAYGSVSEFTAENRLPDAPCCLVLDVRLPGLSGLGFQEQLNRSGVALPIVFLTGHADIRMTVRAMKSGAIDVLTKPLAEQDLLDAVASALEHDRIRRRRAESLADLTRRFTRLTDREREVTALVAAGRLNKQIAGELQISESTVKIHRARVMRKLNVRTVPDLVRISDLVSQVGRPDRNPLP